MFFIPGLFLLTNQLLIQDNNLYSAGDTEMKKKKERKWKQNINVPVNQFLRLRDICVSVTVCALKTVSNYL